MVTEVVSKLNRKTNAHDPMKQRDMRIRNRMIIILLLPAIIFLWLIGWVLSSLPASSRKIETCAKVKLVDVILEEEQPEILQTQPTACRFYEQ